VSYVVEVRDGLNGLWTQVATVSAAKVGSNANYSQSANQFFYNDLVNQPTAYYRLFSVDSTGMRSAASTPFQPVIPPPTPVPGNFELPMTVADADTLLINGFSHIEVWASDDFGNSYNEITAATRTLPTITSYPAQTMFRMGGHGLKFRLDHGPETLVIFDIVIDYWTPQQVSDRINQVSPGRTTVNSAQEVVFTGVTPGRGGSIEITYCDAQDFLPVKVYATGLNARLPLVPGVYFYTFFDQFGRNDTRYKWRFSANGADPRSDYSTRVLIDSDRVPGMPLAAAVGRFVDFEGKPVRQRILISPATGADSVAGYTVGGTQTKVYEADDQGLLQVMLVQGSKIRVAMEGTSIVRDITVPAVASFDLLTLLNGTADMFTIQTTPPILTRRSI
jgi:hypothetical protein